MRNTFAKTFYEIGKQNEKVCLVVADISPAGSIQAFREEFPERFINVGVSEQSMIGLCAGMALRGFKPFAYTIATFTVYRPFEFIRVDLCYQNLPVTVVGVGAGVNYSALGGTHHAQEDIAIMSALPNMTIVAPCDPLEVELATWHCSTSTSPTYLRLGKAGEPILTKDAVDPWAYGKLRFLRKGTDVCLIAYGTSVKLAFEVADELEKTGVRTAVASCHTLKPLDKKGIASVLNQFSRVAVIEEHSPHGGLAAQVKELAWEVQAKCRLKTFSLKDEFIHIFGSHADILQAHGLDKRTILHQIQEGSV